MSDIVSPIEFDDNLIGKNINFSDSVYFCIPGKPKGKERPRTRRFKNFVTTYTPKNTVEYEKLIKKSYHDSTGNVKLENAIEASIVGTFPIPQSVSKKLRSEMINGNIDYTKKIDCDNLAKVVLDALNKIAYDDDSQVCNLHVFKKYGENPKVQVYLKEIKK